MDDKEKRILDLLDDVFPLSVYGIKKKAISVYKKSFNHFLIKFNTFIY